MAVFELPPEDSEHIGRYRVLKVIARGGMGEVLLAWDPDLNRSVAIKRIRHDSDTPILRQRLLQEASAVGRLNHPAIVTVHDLPKYEGDDCIVMEYVPGQTLAEALKRGPLEPALAVHLAKMVASGLAAAHEAGFIHRDLKTENVMVTPSHEAKILDFGVAKPIGITAGDPSLTLAGSVVGTCRAMSPEQAKGAEVDERSDLFSLGILLYETLTGISPFQGSNAPETLNKVIYERPPCVDTLRPGLPPRLVALLVRLLAKEPAGRPQSAGEVVRELEAIAASLSPTGGLDPEETVSVLPTGAVERWRGDPTPAISPPMAMPTPPSKSSTRPRPRRRLMIAILSSLMALVAGAILLSLWDLWPTKTNPPPARPKLLWVVVLNPPGAGHDTQFQHAASALAKASLKTLGHLQGIIPIGPVVESSATGMTRTTAEDLLTVTLEQSGNRGIITLSRIRGRDGKVLGDPSFTAPIDAQNLQGLEKQVEARLQALFSLHPPRVDVSKQGYEAFFDIKQRIDEGLAASESDLSELGKIIAASPHFLEAWLLKADVTVTIYQQNQNQKSRERALQFIREAKKLAPDDPRPLQSEFRLALTEPKENDAQAILSQLEKLEPGNPQTQALHASLAEKRGQTAEALKDWRKAVDYVPSWRNLLGLAKIEEELGLSNEAARKHLEQILEGSPGNTYALRRLAELELDYGDPAKAETIYGNLLKISPTSGDYINLGIARVLRQHYADAISAFNRALEIEPKNAAATLNLADAELALNHQEKAAALYKRVCPQWETGHPLREMTTDDMIQAQCLAHLGHPQEATRIVRNALRQNPDSPDITLSAALVYTLAGDHDDALEMIQDAIAKHVGPNWFKSPSFAPLFKDPKFQQILGGATR